MKKTIGLSWMILSLSLFSTAQMKPSLGVRSLASVNLPEILDGPSIFATNFKSGVSLGSLGQLPDSDAELRIAQQALPDTLPFAITPEYYAGLHQFDPTLGSPFLTESWATQAKQMSWNLNQVFAQSFNRLDPFRGGAQSSAGRMTTMVNAGNVQVVIP